MAMVALVTTIIIVPTNERQRKNGRKKKKQKKNTNGAPCDKPKTIQMKTQTPCTMKNCINTKLAKHKHIMFWNLKSPKKNLRSQKLGFYT